MDASPERRVGRRRRQVSSAPPVWFGIPFVLGGLLTLALGFGSRDAIGGGILLTSGIGLLFTVVGVAVVWTALRAPTVEAPKLRINTGSLDIERFTRSPMQVFVDLVAAPLGGIAFLGMAVLVLFTPMFPAAILAGFFGVLLLKGAAVTVRRGAGLTIATVGPEGIWTRELGQLAWTEIDELRIEDASGIGGPNNTAVVAYRRLGIVPRSQELIDRAPGRDAMGMARWFMSFVNTIRPGTGLSDPMKLAPYGIQAAEIEQPFEEVVRSVQRFAPVAGAEVALGDGTRPVETAGVADPGPASPVAVPAAPSLFEAVGSRTPTLAGASVLTGAPFAGVAQAPAASAESRTFLRSGGPIGTFGIIADAFTVVPWIALPGIFLVVFPAITLLSPDTRFSPVLLIAFAFLLIPLGFVAYGISLLLDMPARWRVRHGGPNVLTIDSSGIELRGMGRLGWSEIEDVRVVDSNRPTSENGPSIPRLEIVPRDRSRLAERSVWDRRRDAWRSFLRRLKPFGDRSAVEPCYALDLDLLDAYPNEVIDLIARYRVVEDET